MARMGKFDAKDLKKFQKELERMDKNVDAFVQSCTKELAARLLRMVVKRTPVGDYSDTYDLEDDGENKFLVMSDKEGGTLRDAWTSSEVRKEGANYVIEITNPSEYASYVEYGHRQQPGRYVPAIGKRLKKGWVKGHLMMTISEQELQGMAPRILERKIEKFLREVLE